MMYGMFDFVQVSQQKSIQGQHAFFPVGQLLYVAGTTVVTKVYDTVGVVRMDKH